MSSLIKLAHKLKIKNAGFTLIEIIVVIGVISIIVSVTYTILYRFNNQQAINNAYENLKNDLNEAKSSASSQVIVTLTCKQPGRRFVGYQVNFGSNFYAITDRCTDGVNYYSEQIRRVNLPSGIRFSTSHPYVLFNILDGSVTLPGTVTITDGSRFKSVTVESAGIIK